MAAALLVLANLSYLLRRARSIPLRAGSLRAWMSAHVATGVLALAAAAVHGAGLPEDSPGGHALWALLVLFGSGLVGRYLYAQLPRAANGRELRVEEARAELAQVQQAWSGARHGFGRAVRREVEALCLREQWGGGFVARLVGFARGRGRLARSLTRLRSAACFGELSSYLPCLEVTGGKEQILLRGENSARPITFATGGRNRCPRPKESKCDWEQGNHGPRCRAGTCRCVSWNS